jgi:hypothetical protein
MTTVMDSIATHAAPAAIPIFMERIVISSPCY